MTVKSILSSIWLSAALIVPSATVRATLDTSGAQANKGPCAEASFGTLSWPPEINSKLSLVGLGGDTPNSAFHFLKAQGFKTVVKFPTCKRTRGQSRKYRARRWRPPRTWNTFTCPSTWSELKDVIPAFVTT